MSLPIVGNSKICSAVDSFLKENRIPHAILIEGDKGTGRHTLAHFLAKAAVCSGENIPCNNCRNCNNADSSCHPDIIFTAPEDGKKNIAVSQIRELRDETYVKPHSANRRVFVIDYADTMNPQSQNALLKVLEEPPGSVIFILIAESKSSLLPTVISRCILLSLTAPEKSVSADYIKGLGQYTENDISNALDSSNNNIGQALRLLSGKDSTETESSACDFIDAFLQDDLWGMLSSVAPYEKNRALADRLFKDLKLKTAQELRKKPNSYSAKRLSRLYTLLCELEKSLVTNINLSLLFSRLGAAATQISKTI